MALALKISTEGKCNFQHMKTITIQCKIQKVTVKTSLDTKIKRLIYEEFFFLALKMVHLVTITTTNC